MRSAPTRLALSGAALACLAAAVSAHAQDRPPAAAAAPSPATSDNDHPEDRQQAIVVLGRLVTGTRDPIYAPVVLEGDALLRQARPQIGQMLERLPGVAASGFAPGVSRPVLRGFDGPRVQILRDGLGSLDASSVSPDHAVSLDTLTVERIEVLHGPQVLLYAPDASAGVVNAIDRRIPRAVPESGATLEGTAAYGTAADSVIGGAAAEVRLAPRLVARLDGGYSRSSDLRVGGHVVSRGLRSELLAQAADLRAAGAIDQADDLTRQAQARGTLPNSFARQWTAGGGLAFIDDRGNIGISVERLSTDYGIPPRPGVHAGGDGHAGEESHGDGVSIALRQTRADLRAAVELGGLVHRLELRGAYGDYGHAELEDGEPHTRFASKAVEARLQAVQARRGIWSGTTGVQLASRRLDVTGDEAVVPDNLTDTVSAFSLQRLSFGTFDVEVAGRYGHTAVKLPGSDVGRNFDHWSGTAGLAWHPAESVNFSLSVSRGERAPSAEELFSDGAHEATQSFERGDPGLRTERSTAAEAGIHFHSRDVLLALTVYMANYSRFIVSVPTGEQIDGLPVFQYIQAKARFRGFEAEGTATLARFGDNALKLDAAADYTHASLPGIGPVPRVPPFRARGGVEFAAPSFSLRGEVEWNARQDRIAANELPVAGFTLVNASATWRPNGDGGPVTLMLTGDNLFDVSARRAASITRDFVPIAGRDIRLTVQVRV